MWSVRDPKVGSSIFTANAPAGLIQHCQDVFAFDVFQQDALNPAGLYKTRQMQIQSGTDGHNRRLLNHIAQFSDITLPCRFFKAYIPFRGIFSIRLPIRSTESFTNS